MTVTRRGGWRRLGRRKPFRYLDGRGARIRDEATLERIEQLVIPPAWRDVWISQLGPYERDWVCAVAVTLVNRGWFRAGSDRSTRTSRSSGATVVPWQQFRLRRGRVLSGRNEGLH